MNEKRNQYWLWAAVGLLLCLNVGTIGWIIRKTEPVRNNRANAEAFLPRRLGFDKQQRRQFRQYRQELRQAVRPQEDSLRQVRAALFLSMQRPTPPADAEIDSLVDQVSRHTVKLARFRFRHWKRIRQLCTPEQRPAFDELMARLVDRLNRPNPNAVREPRQENN